MTPPEQTDAGPLAHAISHELRGPLSTISCCCELLRGRSDAPKLAEYVERIDRAVVEADALLAGFVEYADAASATLDSEPVDLGTLVDEVARDLGGELAAAEASLEHDGLPTVNGDSRWLRALLSHLLCNAARHRRPGEAPHVRIAARRQGRRWRIRFDDDGPGIDEGDRERVFELFETGSGPEDAAGAGVGLALCLLVAHRHDGAIWAEEAPGGGARVVLELPAAGR